MRCARASYCSFLAAPGSLAKLVVFTYSPCCGQKTHAYSRGPLVCGEITIAPSPICAKAARVASAAANRSVQAKSRRGRPRA